MEANSPFSADSLRKDLTQGIDRPLYPLSSYGPGKCVPCIIDGLDESPEELRVAAWAATREAGGIESYVSCPFHAERIELNSITMIESARKAADRCSSITYWLCGIYWGCNPGRGQASLECG
jgi:nucleoporin NUP42